VDILLFNRQTRQAVPATILASMDRSAVEAAAADWEPSIDAAIQRLALAGTPRSSWPEHLHWNWQRKAKAIEGLAGYQTVGVECERQIQGLMLLTTKQKRCKESSQVGLPLVYVHFLEAAPWNLRELTPDPRFGGVGQVLLTEAIRLSMKRGWGGRIGLHSLPQAVPFYRDTVGMSDLGLDTTEGLPYFETTPDQARAYLVR
jgi:hypothetical protein